MRTVLLLCSLLLGLLAPAAALANGYGTYPAPLAWLPDSSGLVWLQSESQLPLNDTVYGNAQLRFIDGSEQRITSGSLASPAFSPDGKWFALVADGALKLFVPDGGRSLQPFGSPSPRTDVLDVCFNAAGGTGQAQLVFSAGPRFYGAAIWALEIGDPDASVFIQGKGGGAEGSTACSPLILDSTRSVFVNQAGYGEPSYERIWVASAQGIARLTRAAQGPPISPDEYHESNPVALPGGEEIIFQRGGWGDWQLIRINVETQAEALEEADAECPSLSADGSWLAFTRREPPDKEITEYDWELPTSVWLKNRETGAAWQVSGHGVAADVPALSPDGQWLAWLEDAIEEAPGGGWLPPTAQLRCERVSSLMQ